MQDRTAGLKRTQSKTGTIIEKFESINSEWASTIEPNMMQWW
jgi:hypothetical protein